MVNKGWQKVFLGEVMQQEIDAVPVNNQPEFQIAGVYSFARGLFARESLPNTQTTYKFFHRLHKDMFVISVPKAWEGALARVTDEFDGWFLSPVFPTFRVDKEKLDIRFFEWYCRQAHVWESLRRKSRGIGARRESVSVEKFLSLEIPLPPLEEQRRIVARIEALAARVQEALSLRERAVEEVDRLFSSSAKALFNNHSWKLISIENLVGRENLKNGKSLKSNELPSEVSCLRISALRDGRIDYTDTKPISITIDEAKPYIIQKNDVYIVRGNGSKDLVGRAGLVNEYKGIIIFPDLFIKVPLNTNQILPTFFVAWWNSPIMREKIVELAKTTSGIWKINQQHIASCDIPLPPLSEQHRIVAHLDAVQAKVDELRRLQAETQAELAALMPSILDRAFKGEL